MAERRRNNASFGFSDMFHQIIELTLSHDLASLRWLCDRKIFSISRSFYVRTVSEIYCEMLYQRNDMIVSARAYIVL